MSLIALKNLGVTLGAPLFANLNLVVGAGDRIGLVAANGRGKSTLLKCLAGAAEPTHGEITRARGLRVGLVEQEIPSGLLGLSVYEAARRALTPEQRATEAWRVDVALDSLNIPEDLRSVSLATLSGGWKRLAILARVWMTDPDILLLDEPTNHLDLQRIIGLEDWLNALPRDYPVIVASHDRAFLDAVTNRTLFLRPEQSRAFAMPYARARAALDEADAADERQHQRDLKTAQQLRKQAAKLNNIAINSGSDLLTVKTKQLKQRAEQIEETARPAHQERSAGAIKLANRGTHAKVLITLNDAAICKPDGALLFKTGKQWIRQGDRIVLLGRNGAGKSLFVEQLRRAVEGAPTPAISATPSLAMGHVDQALSHLDDDATPMEAITRRFEVGDQRARSLLAGAGFSVELQSRPTRVLSGGQKARLAMLVLRLANPNFYLLDEPTNHLDIQGQEALEQEVKAQQASCLVVSHDRSFVRAVGDRFWLIDKRRLIEIESPDDFFASLEEPT